MPKRYKMSRKASKSDFSRNGSKTHRKNLVARSRNPMRGGIRL